MLYSAAANNALNLLVTISGGDGSRAGLDGFHNTVFIHRSDVGMLGAPLNLVLLQRAVQQEFIFIVNTQTDVRFLQLQGNVFQVCLSRS